MNMKPIRTYGGWIAVLIILLVLAICSCRSVRYVPVETVRVDSTVVHDMLMDIQLVLCLQLGQMERWHVIPFAWHLSVCHYAGESTLLHRAIYHHYQAGNCGSGEEAKQVATIQTGCGWCSHLRAAWADSFSCGVCCYLCETTLK